jgi:alginate O-acetyltransferase complex protein AlgI
VLRNTLLLISSLIFYSWGEPVMIVVMLLSIIINYLFGIVIDKYKKNNIKKIILLISVIFNIGVLIVFKYVDFIVETINGICSANILLPNIPLPIGISFFTFQAMSYVIDVYRNDGKVQKNLMSLALYISFFPQLIAGPIVRYKDIDDQIRNRNEDYSQIVEGIKRFIVGLGKKVLIANTVAYTSDQIFNLSTEFWSAGMGWLAVLCYTIQIYFDFSGYSDMAIGLGKMFGFDFLENFNYPYRASSIQEFWRRWHMSLSSWFRDYVYIPLGGNRKGKTRTYINQFLVFLLCGMWHGASWNFIVWGVIHGSFLTLEKLCLQKYIKKCYAPIRHAYTMFIVMMAWVFFRAETLVKAIEALKTMLGIGDKVGYYNALQYITPLLIVVIIVGIIAAVGVPTRLWNNWTQKAKNKNAPNIIAFVGLAIVLILSMMSLASNAYNPFIYFKF